ncbi:flagellar biosynthesis anti-sigma factor FlgM [Photobacterium alginatilyticum]|jgi:negative regulator of flagellin synthesis FlgM|uniref:flagellar biosynthesis anti-sigma factor FlgM n=1 Tax=Photobacterium alginatilyticum TaxID=1775171 RepID=UPI0040677AF7
MIGKISHSQPVALPAEAASKTAGAKTAPVAQVELSHEMKSLQSAKQSMETTSDVDMDKVAQMKAMLNAGKVSVNLDSLAGSMVDFYQGQD